MVDKEIKRKLKRIWCERLVIGLCVSVAFGFSIVKVQPVYHQANLTWKTQQGVQAYQQVKIQPKQALQAQWQKFQQEFLFLAISALCFIGVLLLLLRQRNRISLTLTSQLICFFPEECVAELGALHKQMKSEQRSIWLIRTIMLWALLELFWAFYVQINIQNLWLPQHRKRLVIERLVIGLCVPVALGFSIVKVQSVYREANLTWKAQQAQQTNLLQASSDLDALVKSIRAGKELQQNLWELQDRGRKNSDE